MAKSYTVLYVTQREQGVKVAYTLNGTRYGRLLLIFLNPHAELPAFTTYAQETLKPGYAIETTAVIADTLDQVRAGLERDGALPGGALRVAVEGTQFFDQVIEQLRSDTIWAG